MKIKQPDIKIKVQIKIIYIQSKFIFDFKQPKTITTNFNCSGLAFIPREWWLQTDGCCSSTHPPISPLLSTIQSRVSQRGRLENIGGRNFFFNLGVCLSRIYSKRFTTRPTETCCLTNVKYKWQSITYSKCPVNSNCCLGFVDMLFYNNNKNRIIAYINGNINSNKKQ